MMTEEEWSDLIYEASKPKSRRKPAQPEHELQCACVRWFRYAHPRLAGLLFAIPNGGQRNAIVAAKLNREGVVAGVADLCLAVPRHGYGALYIELKTETGRQSARQRAWQLATESAGNKYVIVRSFDAFTATVTKYLN